MKYRPESTSSNDEIVRAIHGYLDEANEENFDAGTAIRHVGSDARKIAYILSGDERTPEGTVDEILVLSRQIDYTSKALGEKLKKMRKLVAESGIIPMCSCGRFMRDNDEVIDGFCDVCWNEIYKIDFHNHRFTSEEGLGALFG